MATAGELVVLIAAKDEASKALDGIGQKLGGLGKLAGVALAGVAAAGAGFTAAIVGSVGAAMDFESAMSAVGAVAGASGGQLDQLSQMALDLGQNVKLAGISASDAAKAMAALASGGVSTEDILKGAAEGALLLASSAGIDVAQAAEIAAAALNNFGLAGSKTGHIADLFAAASNSSAVTVQDLGESMKYIGPIANSMGLSIEEVTAALAELGDQGIKGSQAGTSLRSILSSLAKPSKQASALINELGLEFFDAGGKMKSLAGISEQLKTHLSGLTDQQRANALVTLFGNEALSAATVLYGEGAAGIAKYLGQVNVAGSAADNGAKRNDNLRGSIEQLKSSWETASITLGTAFIPLVRRMVDALAGAVNAAIPLIAAFGPRFVAALQAGIGQGVAIIQAFAAAVIATVNSIRTGDFSNLFGPLIVAISTAFGPETAGKVTLFVSNLVTGLNLARDAVLTARQAFAGDWVSADSIATPVRIVGEVFLKLGDAVRVVQDLLAKIPQPVLAVAGAFLALGPALQVAALVLPALIGALSGLGPIISFLGATIPIVGGVIAALGGPLTIALVAVGLLAAAWATNFLGIRDATMPVVAAIQQAIETQLLPALANVGPFLATNVLPGWQLAWAGMQEAVAGALEAITPAVGAFVGFLQGSLLPGLQGIVDVAGPAFAQMRDAAVGAFEAARPGIEGFIQGVKDLGAAALPILAAVGRVIIDSLGPAVLAMVDWAHTVIPQFAAAFENVMSIVGPIVGALAELIGSGLGAIAGFVTAHSAEITSVLTNAWNIISSTIGAVFAVITGLISAGLQVISGDWSGAWQTIQATTASVWASIQSVIGSAIAIVGTIVSTAAAEWQALIAAAWAAILSAVASAWGAIVGAVQSGVGQILGVLAGLAGQAGAAAAGIGAAIIAGLTGAILAGAGAVASAAAGVVQGALDAARAALGVKSPSKEFAEIGHMVVAGFVLGIDQKQDEAVKKAADLATSVARAVTDTLKAMQALAGFDFAKNTPSGGQIGALAAFVRDATAQIAALAKEFSEKTLKAAGDFADAANKVVGLIGNGVKGLMALTDFVPPANAAIYAFGKSLRSLINDISLLAEQVTQEAVDQAAAFAEGAGKVVAILGSGVSGFTALINFVAPPVAAIFAFGKSLRSIINDIALLSEQVTQEAVNQAAAFAEGAGKVVGILGTGVAGFTALADFAAPATSAVFAFGKSLRSIINDFALLAEQITQDATDQAAAFAEGAGKVIAIISGGVEGFTKLLTFVAPSQEAIDNFVYAVFEAVRKIAEMASQMSTEGIKLAGEFGDAAGSVLGALKTGLDVFTGLAKLVVPSAKAIDDFAIAVVYAVRKIGDLADQFGKDGIEKAAKFGQSVQTVFGALKSSMDILTNLEKFKDVAEKAFDSLQKGLQAAIDLAQGMVNQSKDMVLLAEEYAANMKKAAALFGSGQSLGGMSPEQAGRKLGEGVISGAREAVGAHSPAEELAKVGRDITAGLVMGMSQTQQDAVKAAADLASSVAKAIQDTLGASQALGKLDVATLPTGGQITGLLGFTRALVAEMAAASTMLSEDATKSTNLFADAASKVASAVSGALGALTGLVTFVAPADRAIFDFGKSLRVAIGDLNALSEEIAPAIVQAAATFSEGAAKALAIFGSSVAGVASLLGFTYTKQLETGIYAFGKATRTIVRDFNYLAEELGTGLAEAAGKFAEGSGKVTAIISPAIDGFTKLLGFTYGPALEAGIYAFGKAVQAIVRDFAYLADEYGVGLADAAGKWADGAGKVLAIVANGVAGLTALKDYVSPAYAAMQAFVADTRALVGLVSAAGWDLSQDGLDAATRFADAAGKVLSTLSGVKGLADLKDYLSPPMASMEAFAADARALVKLMIAVGSDFEQDGLDAASTFADAGGKVLGMVGAAVSGFKDLLTFISPPESAMQAFATSVRDMIVRMVEIAGTLATDGVDAAGKLGEGFSKVFGGLSQATSFFKSLDGILLPDQGGIDRILAPILATVGAVAAAAGAFDPATLARATAFADAFGSITGNIQAGNRNLLGGGGGGTGGGGTTQLIFNGPIYGTAEFDQRIQQALVSLDRTGAR